MSLTFSRQRSGFTLIELLIVVSIIGILSAIAIPQYNKYRQRAQDAVAVSAIDQIITAQQLHFLDNNKYATSYTALAALSLTKDANVNYGAITLANNGADYKFTLSHKAPSSTLFTYDSASTSHKYLTSVSAGLATSSW
jgi:prepilin-type N-terminal cleavage/methylation domain-containing protein